MFNIIFISFLVLSFMFIIWASIRNERVYLFRTKLIDIAYKLGMESINNGNYGDYYYIFDKLPSYDKMVMSFKPLKPKYWLSEEDYLKIIKHW